MCNGKCSCKVAPTTQVGATLALISELEDQLLNIAVTVDGDSETMSRLMSTFQWLDSLQQSTIDSVPQHPK